MILVQADLSLQSFEFDPLFFCPDKQLRNWSNKKQDPCLAWWTWKRLEILRCKSVPFNFWLHKPSDPFGSNMQRWELRFFFGKKCSVIEPDGQYLRRPLPHRNRRSVTKRSSFHIEEAFANAATWAFRVGANCVCYRRVGLAVKPPALYRIRNCFLPIITFARWSHS